MYSFEHNRGEGEVDHESNSGPDVSDIETDAEGSDYKESISGYETNTKTVLRLLECVLSSEQL